MQPIISGYDGSDGAKGAVDFAGRTFTGRQAIVVTAFENWPPAVHGDAVAVDEATWERVDGTAREGAALAGAVGLVAEPRSLFTADKAWKAIIDAADELDVELIVVGSHGFSGLRPLVLGSVSHQLAHHAHQPVLAVPTPAAVVARRERNARGGVAVRSR